MEMVALWKLIKRFWPLGAIAALLIAGLWIKDTIDDAIKDKEVAEAKATAAEARATQWKSAVDNQNAAVKDLGDQFVSLQKRLTERDQEFKRRWAQTNQAVGAVSVKTEALLNMPPAPVEQSVEAARAALKETQGFGYLEIDHVEK